MGREKAMDVVYDTGSDWVVIEGQDCQSCEGDRYDISNSVENGRAEKISEE